MAITWSRGPAGAGAPAAGGRIGPVGTARAGLLLAWTLVAAAAWVLGSAPATYTDLQQELRDGRVSEVWAQPGHDDGGTGSGYQRVEWRDGWTSHHTRVMTASPGEPPLATDVPLVGADVAPDLRAVAPQVQVHRLPHQLPSTSSVQGYEVPTWVWMLAACLFISSHRLHAGGPERWWATRWAWFWVSLLPGGVIAFLLLSGPLPGLPRLLRRRPGAWQLGGGWAFLLAAVVWWG